MLKVTLFTPKFNSEIRQWGLLKLYYIMSSNVAHLHVHLDMVQVKTLNAAFTTVLKDLRIPVLFKANVLSRE